MKGGGEGGRWGKEGMGDRKAVSGAEEGGGGGGGRGPGGFEGKGRVCSFFPESETETC